MPTKATRRSAASTTGSSRKAAQVRPQKGTVFVTRQVHFNSAHRLYNPTKSKAWNQKQYGLCSNPLGHGHNYVLEVTVKGETDPVTGYLIDLGELKHILNTAIVDKVDHRNLNEEVAFLKGIIPSTENLVIAFWGQIEPHIKSGQLHCVRLYETPRNYAEFFGPEVS